MRNVELIPLKDFPLVAPGTDLAALIAGALTQQGLALQERDVVVVAQKIVSKAEDRFVRLDSVTPSAEAVRISEECRKDARIVEVILRESNRIVRLRKDLIIAEHRQGFIMANAGVDQSNIGGADEEILLLPLDALAR